MHIVDRPHPTNHEYKSVKFIVWFTWGQPDSPIPLSGWVQIESMPNQALPFHPSAPWNIIDEARDDVITQAKKVIDAGIQ
jgi:hypothetical protein